MRSIAHLGRRGRSIAALAVVGVVAASVVALAVPASSQGGPSDNCTGDHVFDANSTFGNRSGTIYSVPPTQSRTFSIAAVPAGRRYNARFIALAVAVAELFRQLPSRESRSNRRRFYRDVACVEHWSIASLSLDRCDRHGELCARVKLWRGPVYAD